MESPEVNVHVYDQVNWAIGKGQSFQQIVFGKHISMQKKAVKFLTYLIFRKQCKKTKDLT